MLLARALHDRLLKRYFPFQPTVRCDLMHRTSATCRFSNDCYLAWVATEFVNVLLNPFQGESLIEKASISDSFALKRWPREESLMRRVSSVSQLS